MGQRKLVTPTAPGHAGKANLTRLMTPSAELAAIVGAEPLSRPQVNVELWRYIRAVGAQDPQDRRVIFADDRLRPIIGERCTMFALAKLIGPHLTAAA